MEWTEVPPVCAPNTTTLFSECPQDLRAPMSKWTWHGKSLATCEKEDGQLVGIESTEGNCLSCLSCDSEAARQAAERMRELGGEGCGGNNLGFRCLDDGVCWEEEFVCDGYEQCGDGTKEVMRVMAATSILNLVVPASEGVSIT